MDGKVYETSSLKEECLSDEWAQYKQLECVVQLPVIRWWYHLTTPAESSLPATNNRREVMRRTRIASILMFFLVLLLTTLVLPAAIFAGDRAVLLLACLLLSIIMVAILFNRCGKFHVAGALVACGLSGVFYTSILTNASGLTIVSLLLFNGLALSELFIASLLPGSWIFLATLINSLFIVTTFMMIPETTEVARIMQTKAYIVMMCLVVLHVVISGVVWFWSHSAAQANERADHAEKIATLQRTLTEQEHIIAQQKQLLDSSIGQIMCTHVQVANGNLAARVPIEETLALQPLAVALNNLLNRLQRLRQVEKEFLAILPYLQRGKQAEYELQRAKGEVEFLLRAIREGRQANRCIRIPRGGTLLAPLFQEINGQYISLLPSYGKSTTAQLLAHDEIVSDGVAK
ncbi:MAG: hypothetical protein H0V70_15330 [Ktedonobacteraceae bacterium]|nr:hypothetical protein [Ktedonobacteraceae bacterium]